MNLLIVYAHPNPNSFNAAILAATKSALTAQGHALQTIDLYQQQFNPLLDVASLLSPATANQSATIRHHQVQLTWAQGLLFIHPVWWYGPPAILKGWVDRVFTEDFAFRLTTDNSGPEGLLTIHQAFVIETAAAPQDILAAIPYQSMFPAILRFCGINNCQVTTLAEIATVPRDQRQEMLATVSADVSAAFKEV